MWRKLREVYRLDKRTYKNFGHKREPQPLFTVLWQGFLTFSFIGMGIEWKRMYRFFFDEEPERSSLTDLE